MQGMDFGRRAQRLAGCMLLLMLLVFRADLGAEGEEEGASHRQRLADPATTQVREEQEASARLKTNPRDSQALRSRGLPPIPPRRHGTEPQ